MAAAPLSSDQHDEVKAILEEVAARLETDDEYRVDLNYMSGPGSPPEAVWDEAVRQANLRGWAASRTRALFVVKKP